MLGVGLLFPSAEDNFVPRRGHAPPPQVWPRYGYTAAARLWTHLQSPQRRVGLTVRNRGLHNHSPRASIPQTWAGYRLLEKIRSTSTLIISPCNLRPLRKRINNIKHWPSQQQFTVCVGEPSTLCLCFPSASLQFWRRHPLCTGRGGNAPLTAELWVLCQSAEI